MSPRATWRLESLGFGEVYDYVAGSILVTTSGGVLIGLLRREDLGWHVQRGGER